MKPPIVSSVVHEAIQTVIAIDKALTRTDRLSVEQTIDLGKALWQLKQQAGHGNWLAALEKTGVPQPRASEAMRAARLQRDQIAACANKHQLLKTIGPPGDELADERQPGDEDDDYEEKPTLEPLCQRCQRIGSKVKNCQACAELLAKPAPKRGRPAKTAAPPAPQSGTAKFNWQWFDEYFRPIAQAADNIVRAYPDEKHSTEYVAAQAALNEYLKIMQRWKKRLS